MSPVEVAGIINLYKPTGKSSARYVYRLRRILGIRKVGHAGTLDPFADGVLIACIGRATKLTERLMGLSKHYRTTLRLGVTNATFDPEMPFDPVPDAQPISRENMDAALASFRGTIEQTPPAFSAIKVSGSSSYNLARRGEAVFLPSRPVRIDRLDVMRYDWPHLELELVCGRGTYIRAIARDLGAKLGCGACCESLTRLAVGPFRLDSCLNLETAGQSDVQAAILSIEDAGRLLHAQPRSPGACSSD